MRQHHMSMRMNVRLVAVPLEVVFVVVVFVVTMVVRTLQHLVGVLVLVLVTLTHVEPHTDSRHCRRRPKLRLGHLGP